MTAKKARILIVESDADAGARLAIALNGFGHRAVWVHDTDAAIDELRGAWADLVLIDTASPATIGAAESLARYAGFFDIPVVLMSAAPDARERLPYPWSE
jgi:DNA-binding response OmpR family regulator